MLQHRLRSLREEIKKTQLDVANAINISRVRYNNYETGKRAPDYDTLQLLSQYYDVSVDYLIGKSDIRHLENTESNKFKRDELRIKLDEVLEKNGIVKPGEDLTDDQLEWLMKLVDKAIDMTKMGE